MVKVELFRVCEQWCNKDQKKFMDILIHHYFISLKSIRGDIWIFGQF